MNLANLKKVKGQDLDIMKKLFKQIQGSKHSSPFKKPLDRRTNKKYFELVKEPMGEEYLIINLMKYREFKYWSKDTAKFTQCKDVID